MRKKWNKRDIWKAILWLSAMLIVIVITIIWYRIVSFNMDIVCVDAKETGKTVYIEGTDITDSNDSWATVIQQSENPADVIGYTGVTCSINVINQNSFNIKDWQLTMHITDECYLSGFWCGSVTVYQYRDGQTIETEIQNQAVDVTSLTDIDRNIYTDDMMIHLLPGDYLVYSPSVKEKEDVVEANEAVGIGFILYYADSLNLSDWELSYRNDMRIVDHLAFKILFALACIWTGALILYLSLSAMEKRVRAQMNSRIKNISIMTDLYLEAYIINIAKNTAQMIKGD